MNNEEEGGHEINRVPQNNLPQNAQHNVLYGELPRNDGDDRIPETRPLLNGNVHQGEIGERQIGDGDVHHNGVEGGGAHQIVNGPVQIGAGRNDGHLQDNGELECDGGNDSRHSCDKQIDREHFALQDALNTKTRSNGGQISGISFSGSDTSTSEAGCPVASPSTDINLFVDGATGTRGTLDGKTNGVNLNISIPSVGLGINRQTHRQESKSENNQPIASPSDSESPDSSLNSNDTQVNPKRLLSGGTEPLPSDLAEVNYDKGQLTPDENEEDTEQKRSYRRSMEDSGFGTHK